MKKGFTLLELLVVISIIGLLTVLVLSALNASRNKGYDGKTKSELTHLRSQIEIYYYNQTPTSYGVATNSCSSGMFASANIAKILTALPTTPVCRSTGSGYAISAPLLYGSGNWCIDSGGLSMDIPSPLASGDVTCN